jgi:hypothetical protein
VVGVADFGIELGEKIFLFGKYIAAAHEPVNDLLFSQ